MLSESKWLTHSRSTHLLGIAMTSPFSCQIWLETIAPLHGWDVSPREKKYDMIPYISKLVVHSHHFSLALWGREYNMHQAMYWLAFPLASSISPSSCEVGWSLGLLDGLAKLESYATVGSLAYLWHERGTVKRRVHAADSNRVVHRELCSYNAWAPWGTHGIWLPRGTMPTGGDPCNLWPDTCIHMYGDCCIFDACGADWRRCDHSARVQIRATSIPKSRLGFWLLVDALNALSGIRQSTQQHLKSCFLSQRHDWSLWICSKLSC